MKTLLLTLLLFLSVGLSAQTTIDILRSNSGTTYVDYLKPVTLTNTTAQALYFYMKPDCYTAVNYVTQLDSAAGNHTNVAVALYGRISEKQGWTQIGSTINWKGINAAAGCDTTILFTNATETAYQQYKLLFTPTGTGVSTVCYQALKIWNGIP